LKLTIAQYLTPGDISIQTIGVTPDIEYQPSYVDPRKLSLFKTRSHIRGEKDLKEHIVSDYLPKEPEKPLLTVHYLKPYKTPEELLKESRRERYNAFRNDEEIQMTSNFLKMRLAKKEPILAAAVRLGEEQRDLIIAQMGRLGIVWKKDPQRAPVDLKALKVEIVGGAPLKAGAENKLVFRATYPGEIDNLEAVLETDMPPLRNLEIPFGSFSGQVERVVPVSVPEHLPWRRQPVRMDLSFDEFRTVARSESLEIEILPFDMPEVEFSYVAEDSVGAPNGLVEEGEEVDAHIAVRNAGKGALLDGRVQLINVYNSPEMFISKGTEPLVLKPGEEREVTLRFKVSSLQSAKSRIGIAVSLYDYKPKYAAGFSIPFAQKDLSCRFTERKGAQVSIPAETPLYGDIRLASPVATTSAGAVFRLAGQCGDAALRVEGGYWVRASDVKPTTAAPDQKPAVRRRYPVAMPAIVLDRAPVSAPASEATLSFSVTGDDVQDVFVFQNDRKVFYYRSEPNAVRRQFSVPLRFREKANRVVVSVKGADRERGASAVKYFFYPAGSDEGERNDREDEE